MFKSNVGLGDRVIRIVLGLFVLAMVFVGPQIIWGWLGLYPLITGAFGVDPLYRLLKIDTHPPKHLTGGF